MAFPGIHIDGGTTSSLLNYVIGTRNADNERHRIDTTAELEREKLTALQGQHDDTIKVQVMEIEKRFEAARLSVDASNKATEAQERISFAQIAAEDKKAAREFSRIQRMTNSAEQQAALLNARQHIDRTGDTLQATTAKLAIEAQAHFGISSDQLTDEKLKEYAVATDQYKPYQEAVRAHTNVVNAIVAGNEQINARASGYVLRTMSTDDPEIKSLLDAKGLKADGETIGVYTQVDENGKEKIVDVVKTSQGLPAVSDNAFAEYNLAKVFSAGVGALSPEESKAMAEDGVQLARNIAEAYAQGKISAEAANAELSSKLALLDGNADAARAQAQAVIDGAAKGFIVTDPERYQKSVKEALDQGLINVATPERLPASDLGLARNLNSLDRLAAGAGVAFNYSDRAGDAAREDARKRAASRMEYGLALTGAHGELKRALDYRLVNKSPDNNERQAYNEQLAGAKTDVDSLDFNKNATGTAADFVSRYVKKGGIEGQFSPEQRKAIRQRIIDNYSKWSTELGLPEDMSKLGPRETELLWRKAATQEARATRGGLTRAGDALDALGRRVLNVASKVATIPTEAISETIATGSPRQGLISALTGPARVINAGDLPPSEAEPGRLVIDRYGQVVASPYSGAEHALKQGNPIESGLGAAAILREERERKNYPPTTYR